MFYYEVLARLHSYHGADYLTYSSPKQLPVGTIIKVAVRSQTAPAIVMAPSTKPAFKTKPISEVIDLPPLPALTIKLIEWLRSYYPSPLGLLAQLFLPKILPKQAEPASPNIRQTELLPELTAEQKRVVKEIEAAGQNTVLLHGITGSGKTRVYIELMRRVLSSGKSALLLTPEISLTPQLVSEVQKGLPGAVVLVMHSALTDAQRRTAWMRVLQADEPIVVIGPRSALFVPFKALGLIVVDEFHEPAYKQEQAPYYQAVRVAGKLAQLHGATAVLGSATPPVQEFYLAEQKQAPILRLSQLATGQPALFKVEVVDLRDKTQLTRHPHLSNRLLEAVDSSLKSGGQALIFLNRRGTARLVMCQQCGWQALCPNCDLPLTYHGDSHKMRCHTCGLVSATPSNCPNCASTDLLFKSIGTKSLAESLERLFPGAKVQRFDSDSIKTERFEQHYEAVKAGRVDILVGTQLLAKGLDLPRLGVVGVVLADSSLYMPDYTAEERTYQLLNQVMGRVGRGHRAGTAVIQTYRPDGPAINAALNKDWESFYKEQLKERQAFLFPPFCFLMKLTVKRASRASAAAAAEELAASLRRLKRPVQVIGPSPAFYEKAAGKYHWQIVIKAKERKQLTGLIAELPANWTYDLDPSNLL